MPCYLSVAEAVSNEKTTLVWTREEDVNRDKVGYRLTGFDGYRRIKFEARAAHGDGANGR